MTATVEVTLPESVVAVLTAPLTYAQYEKDPGLVDGVITAVVSLDFHKLVDNDYDSNLDYIADAVVSELGEDWTLESYRVVGLDPRRNGSAGDGCYALVRVALYPGSAQTAGASELFNADRRVANELGRVPFVASEQVKSEIMSRVVTHRRRGHRLALDLGGALGDDLELLLSCSTCDGVHQLVLDASTGALCDESIEGDLAGNCLGI